MTSEPSKVSLTVVGDESVGKTALIYRLRQDSFMSNTTPTNTVAFESLSFPSANAVLQIWDTAGQERFASVTEKFLRQGQISIVCFDITRPASFDHVQDWLDKINNACQVPPYLLIVGTKCDLIGQLPEVATDTIEEFTAQAGLLYYQVSSVTGEGVGELKGKLEEVVIELKGSGGQPEPIRPEEATERICC
jgi:Ras-related protein Rab-5C